MIRQSIQALLNKLGYQICKKARIETIYHENEKLKKIHHKSGYGEFWDHYVEEDFNNYVRIIIDEHGQQKYKWPGDEWGDQEFWEKVFNQLFVKHVPPESRYFVEIGPGSGKYSLLVLEQYENANLKCFDVSSEYLNVLKERCRKPIEEDRLEPILLAGNDHNFLRNNLEQSEWVGKVDCLFSIDSMVHVDLQYLISYWITAAQVLREGGKLIMSVADATNDGGFAKLIGDVRAYFPLQEKMSSKFEWLSPDLVQSVLGRLGFEMTASENLNNRDFWFVATLIQKREMAPW